MAPRNEVEKRISEIWAQSLKVDQISVEDDFFLLGGQSLKATSLISTYEREFQVRISLKQLFENTTLEGHAKLIENGREETFTNIPTIAEAACYEISDAQRRLWVLSRFDGASVAYNIPFSMQLEIKDVATFKRAIFTAIDRHEILRTIFKKDSTGEVKQWILPSSEINFTIKNEDFRTKENQAEAVKAYMAQDAFEPFNLEDGPLMRASLLQVSDSEYVFYCNMHHIVSDGWSMEVLMKDVNSYYDALLAGLAISQEALTIQYKDYAAWHLDQITNEAYSKERKYWANKLQGTIPAINLPSQKQRPQIKTYNGKILKTNIDATTTTAIRSFIAENGGSLFTFALAGFNAMIHRYTGEKDITIGTPVAGRNHADLQNQIGFYVNTLALRNEIVSGENFATFYNRVKTDTITDLDNQMYPFDRLVEDLETTIDTSRSAIFDIMLIVQNIGDIKQENVDSEENADAIQELGETRAKFDLSLTLEERANSIQVHVTYNTDVYEQQLIEQFVTHFKTFVYEAINASDKKYNEIRFTDKKETLQLLEDGKGVQIKAYQGTTLLDAFKEQVNETPESIAVQYNDTKMTYGELDLLSNQFVNYLRQQHKVTQGALIGFELDRSEWIVVCMLGILKAGAAYIPIDVNYPQARKDYIKNDSAYDLCITNNVMNDFVEVKEAYSNALLENTVNSSDLAYIIYTSGSTGNPKGVKITHESLANYLNWACAYYIDAAPHNADFGLFTSLSFDLTVTSIYLPLLQGGKLTVFDASLDISEVLKSYMQQDIACIKLTPAHISLLDSLSIKTTNVQFAIVGGDALQQQHIDILQKLNPNIRIVNEYGPTEATIGCCIDEVNSKDDITIGTPIWNTQVYVLNEANVLQPNGVAGELCISGKGLSAGYNNQTLLTMEKFVPNPFKKGELLYKTGDVVTQLTDGRLQYIGRIDDQVKIRGYRVELGAIESKLLERPSVQEAVVRVYTNTEGEKQLVAYVVSSMDESISDIRAHLAASLPLYMLPEAFVQLDVMPLTINGKIDKEALPNPNENSLQVTTTYEAPTNEMQETLATLIAKELNKEKDTIGIQDNFFDLGVNSMKLLRILEFFNTKYQLSAKPVSMFQYPNIKSFVDSLDTQKEKTEVISKEEENLLEAVDEFMDLL